MRACGFRTMTSICGLVSGLEERLESLSRYDVMNLDLCTMCGLKRRKKKQVKYHSTSYLYGNAHT